MAIIRNIYGGEQKSQLIKGTAMVVDSQEILWGSNIPTVFEKVIKVNNGEDALGKFRKDEKAWSAIICNWDSPGLTGIEFLMQIRDYRRPQFDIPFMIVIASNTKDELLQKIFWASETGVNDVLLKPFSINNVNKKITDLANYFIQSNEMRHTMGYAIKMLQKGSYEQAFQALKICEAIDEKEEYAQALAFFRGKIYESSGDGNKAVEHYLQSLGKARYHLYAPSREALVNLYFHQENYEDALQEIEEAITISPLNIKWRLLKGKLHLAMGKSKEAEDVFAKLIDQNPRNKQAVDEIYDSLRRTGKILNEPDDELSDSAREFLDKHIQNARSYLERGLYAEALRSYGRALDVDPKNKKKYYASLGLVNWRWHLDLKSSQRPNQDYRQLKDAIGYFLDVLKIDPWFTDVQKLLAKIVEVEGYQFLDSILTTLEIIEVERFTKKYV